MEIRISLTELVDVVSRAGTTKLTRIAQIKGKPEYAPAFDFYKPLRDYLKEFHKNNGSTKDFADATGLTTDKKKHGAYSALIKGYKKFLGRKKIAWFKPTTDRLLAHDVEVSVNPEIGLGINGTRYLIKLYFKEEKLTKQRVDVILQIMENVLRPRVGSDVQMAILDVRSSKLFSKTRTIKNLDLAIDAELAYVSAVWEKL